MAFVVVSGKDYHHAAQPSQVARPRLRSCRGFRFAAWLAVRVRRDKLAALNCLDGLGPDYLLRLQPTGQPAAFLVSTVFFNSRTPVRRLPLALAAFDQAMLLDASAGIEMPHR